MKKFLLLAVLLVSAVGAAAQTETPEGEKRGFFVLRSEGATPFTDYTDMFFARVTKETFVVADDGTVYIPYTFYYYGTPVPSWVKGTLSADGSRITVKGNQYLGSFDGVDFNLMLWSNDGRALPEFVFNLETDRILGNDVNWCAGGLIGNGYVGFTPFSEMSIYPADSRTLFNEPVERRLTGTMVAGGVETEVDAYVVDYDSPYLGVHFIKGAMPYYPDGWLTFIYSDEKEGDILTDGNFVARGVIAYFPSGDALPDETNMLDEINSRCTFALNADGSYSMADGRRWANLYYDSENERLVSDAYCYGLTLGAPLSTGVSAASAQAAPAATEYYDLSGRRVSGNATGLTIRVDKYADGTRRTTKVFGN